MKAVIEVLIHDNGRKQYETIEISQDEIEALAMEKCQIECGAENVSIYETVFTTES